MGRVQVGTKRVERVGPGRGGMQAQTDHVTARRRTTGRVFELLNTSKFDLHFTTWCDFHNSLVVETCRSEMSLFH